MCLDTVVLLFASSQRPPPVVSLRGQREVNDRASTGDGSSPVKGWAKPGCIAILAPEKASEQKFTLLV